MAFTARFSHNLIHFLHLTIAGTKFCPHRTQNVQRPGTFPFTAYKTRHDYRQTQQFVIQSVHTETFRTDLHPHRSRNKDGQAAGANDVWPSLSRLWSECHRWFSSGCDVMSSGLQQVRCFGATCCLSTHLAATVEHPVPDISSSRHPAKAATGPAFSTWHVCSGTRPDGGQSVWLVTRKHSAMPMGWKKDNR